MGDRAAFFCAQRALRLLGRSVVGERAPEGGEAGLGGDAVLAFFVGVGEEIAGLGVALERGLFEPAESEASAGDAEGIGAGQRGSVGEQEEAEGVLRRGVAGFGEGEEEGKGLALPALGDEIAGPLLDDRGERSVGGGGGEEREGEAESKQEGEGKRARVHRGVG